MMRDGANTNLTSRANSTLYRHRLCGSLTPDRTGPQQNRTARGNSSGISVGALNTSKVPTRLAKPPGRRKYIVQTKVINKRVVRIVRRVRVADTVDESGAVENPVRPSANQTRISLNGTKFNPDVVRTKACFPLSRILSVEDTSHLDLLYIGGGQGTLSLLRLMDWEVPVRVLVVESLESAASDIRLLLAKYGFVRADYNIMRYCPLALNLECPYKQVFLNPMFVYEDE